MLVQFFLLGCSVTKSVTFSNSERENIFSHRCMLQDVVNYAIVRYADLSNAILKVKF